MEEFGLTKKTKTKDGYNPLLKDIVNINFTLVFRHITPNKHFNRKKEKLEEIVHFRAFHCCIVELRAFLCNKYQHILSSIFFPFLKFRGVFFLFT